MKSLKFIEKYWIAFAALAGILAAALTLYLAKGQSVWFDEGYSILLAKSHVNDLLALTAVDAHPPLYYLLLKLWGAAFNFNEFALRSLSAVFLGLAVFVGLLFVRRVFSVKVALIAAPFVVFAPFLLRYGYEIRMYAMAGFIAITATYALVRAWQTKKWAWWAVYAVFVAMGMYTLYMMAAIFLAHVVWLLVVSIKSKQRPFWRWQWWYAYAGAVVLFLPYLPTLVHQFTHSALPGVGEQVTLTELGNVISTLSLYTPGWALGGWLSIALVVLIVILSIWGIRAYRTLRKEQKAIYMLIVALAVIPLVFYALLSLPPRAPIFIVRYMAHGAIFIYLLVGIIVGLAWARKGLKRSVKIRTSIFSIGVLAVFLAGTLILQHSGNFVFERMQHPMTRELRQTITCNDKTTIVADDPYTYIDERFYFDGCNFKFFSKDNIEFRGGYAMLHGSDARIADSSAVTTPVLVHLSWVGNQSQFTPDSRYHLVSSEQFDKQKVDTYQLNAE